MVSNSWRKEKEKLKEELNFDSNKEEKIAKLKRFKEYDKKYDQKPEVKERKKEYYFKKTYGITLNDYKEMLKTQNYKCKICANIFGIDRQKIACIDHNHQTGEIRGLLCSLCNWKLGFVELMNRKFLINAMKYLKLPISKSLKV
jgi:hypothetical protein